MVEVTYRDHTFLCGKLDRDGVSRRLGFLPGGLYRFVGSLVRKDPGVGITPSQRGRPNRLGSWRRKGRGTRFRIPGGPLNIARVLPSEVVNGPWTGDPTPTLTQSYASAECPFRFSR